MHMKEAGDDDDDDDNIDDEEDEVDNDDDDEYYGDDAVEGDVQMNEKPVAEAAPAPKAATAAAAAATTTTTNAAAGGASTGAGWRAPSAEERRRARDIAAYADKINYSARYSDDLWEYRHVTMPKELVKYIPEDRLMPEDEWRGLGVKQSLGWEHYMIHKPEPHVLLFRREKDYQIKYPNGKPADSSKTGGLAH
ncbi:hypothetical protein RI367_000717 [Sorochytrium milnesiophthora]